MCGIFPPSDRTQDSSFNRRALSLNFACDIKDEEKKARFSLVAFWPAADRGSRKVAVIRPGLFNRYKIRTTCVEYVVKLK